jgi:pimeloyl-ACP methyl ester carboxylesterase
MAARKWIKRVAIGIGTTAVVGFVTLLAIAHWQAARWSKSEIDGVQPKVAETRHGWRTQYFASGDPNGQRVIFVHGTPGRAADFAAFVRNPIDPLEMVAIDRPGFGGSQPRDALPKLADQAAAIEPLLVERNGRWPILVGHSLGGPIVCRTAADFPGRVGGLVIAAGSLDPELEAVHAIQRVGDLGLVSWLLPQILRNSNRELIPLEQELRRLKPLLSGIESPTIIVHGDRDSLVPVENVPFMEKYFPDGVVVETVILKGANHFLPWRQEPALRDAIRKLADIKESS